MKWGMWKSGLSGLRLIGSSQKTEHMLLLSRNLAIKRERNLVMIGGGCEFLSYSCLVSDEKDLSTICVTC